MYYLIHPHAPLKWNDLPSSMFKLAIDHQLDLAQLEWKPAEEPHDHAVLVELALRHGIPCSAGIALSAGFVGTAERPILLRRNYQDLQRSAQHPGIRATDQFMDELAPGWIESGRELDARVDESVKEATAQAEREAERDMAAPKDPGLVQHWIGLGGIA